VLELAQIELTDLSLALEDQSEERKWWLDLSTGAINPEQEDDPLDPDAWNSTGAQRCEIQPMPVAVAYGDMEDFVARVRDAPAREVLERSIVGRGAFRRFKDALLELPELRQAWFEFHDARSERRAIEWLVENELIDAEEAEEELAARPDPDFQRLPALIDGFAVARRTARDIRRLYRDRLRGVLLLGAWARGDAHPESPVELLVILDSIPDRWEEKRRMDRIMWRHSRRNDTVVTEVPTTQDELDRAATPFLARARVEGVRVA
jgi:hypothetical protein